MTESHFHFLIYVKKTYRSDRMTSATSDGCWERDHTTAINTTTVDCTHHRSFTAHFRLGEDDDHNVLLSWSEGAFFTIPISLFWDVVVVNRSDDSLSRLFDGRENGTLTNGTWNNSMEPEVDLGTYPDFAQIAAVRLAFMAVYTAIIILTVAGNVLVIATVMGQRKMHNSVNYLICNLAGKSNNSRRKLDPCAGTRQGTHSCNVSL